MKYKEVIAIKFDSNGRKYYFEHNNLPLKKNEKVIVETEKGFQYGICETNIIKMPSDSLFLPLKKVIRIANKKDITQHKQNILDAKNAKEKCISLAKKDNLDMNIIDARYNFDRTQLCFYFISSGRVDFRELAKKLASIYKVRIELKQIGPRDKAKEIGGIGPCGRPLCCSKYLYTFSNITINMAKNQNISLNPSKINGACNRLLCCLSYEDDLYSEYKKDLPKVGEYLKEYSSKVISVDPLSRKVRLEKEDKTVMELEL